MASSSMQNFTLLPYMTNTRENVAGQQLTKVKCACGPGNDVKTELYGVINYLVYMYTKLSACILHECLCFSSSR